MNRKILSFAAAVTVSITAALTAPVTAAVADTPPPPIEPMIVGGHPAASAPPGITSLQYDAPEHGEQFIDYHTCGGALVFRGWVVTAAHCVTDPPTGAAAKSAAIQRFTADAASIPTADKRFHVRVGSLDRLSGGETATVTKIVVHPGWKWAQGAPKKPVSDIAMLKLDHLLQQPTVQLARDTARRGSAISLYGWGVTEPDSTHAGLPRHLQQLDTRVTAPSRCADAALSAAEICTDNPSGTDAACYGDSGGPALATINGITQLVGGASRSATEFCGTAPDVYTSSPDFRDWIYHVARTGNAT
ncbi:S1 family peptidase [Prauserella endophytica]|uniref:S1 family peptidase n=1 Tax=Prauserella endophytica TaxID=1592324 RepID=UPI001E29C4AA|nr:serine protease [Prauserella endophytica]